MKLLPVLLPFLTWLLPTNNAAAQIPGALAMRSTTTVAAWDTLCFSRPYSYIPNDSIRVIGQLEVQVAGYTIIRSGKKAISCRCARYYTDYGGDVSLTVSDWLTIEDDSLLTWLDTNLAATRHEELAPFIYRQEYAGYTHYESVYTSHPSIFTVFYNTPEGQFENSINLLDISPTLHDGSIKNLNYPYNTSTKFYQLYLMLEQRCQVWDRQYRFPHLKKMLRYNQ